MLDTVACTDVTTKIEHKPVGHIRFTMLVRSLQSFHIRSELHENVTVELPEQEQIQYLELNQIS